MKTKYTKEVLELAAIKSHSISECVRVVTGSKKAHGCMVALFSRLLKSYDIDTSHFNGKRWCFGKVNPTGIGRSREEFVNHFLVKDGPFITTVALKKKLIAFGILKYQCSSCGIGPEWNGGALTLQLDHVDGDRGNNEISNLSIKCPNCHSQTSTFAGKNNLRR